MFDNPLFTTTIALITIYLLFSQLTLSLVELPAGFLNQRGHYLYVHLQVALGLTLGPKFYDAPAIKSLMLPTTQQNGLLRRLGIQVSQWPPYVSETLFAQTIVATVSGLVTAPTPPLSPFAQFQAGLAFLAAKDPKPNFAGVLATYANAAATMPDPGQALQKNLEAWFHEYGERMTGWYKRDQRWPLFVVGLLVAGLADVDTVRLAHFIADSNNAKARLVLVESGVRLAQAAVVEPGYNPTHSPPPSPSPKPATPGILIDSASEEFRTTLAAVPAVGLPLGWLRWTDKTTVRSDTTTRLDSSTHRRSYAKPGTFSWGPTADDYGMPVYAQRWTLDSATGEVGHPQGWSWLSVLGGWLLTGFAMMLGAPFWFETLNRFVNVRNIGIKPSVANKTKT